MLGRRDGFTLAELLITMAVTVFVLAMASSVLTALITQFKQQSKIAETGIESVIGLELMRRDVQSAGFGLPWSIGSVQYQEAAVTNASAFNDAPTTPPRAVVANAVSYAGVVANSDYLVVKSLTVARNVATERFALLYDNNVPGVWDPASENLSNGDRAIVLSPAMSNTVSLVEDTSVAASDPLRFTAIFNATAMPAAFSPISGSKQTNILYGVDERNISLRMPFNRADFFVVNSPGYVPARCAGGTGVLVKAVIDHNGGGYRELTPLLDCVADMQVVFGLDMDEDGTVGTYAGVPVGVPYSPAPESATQAQVLATFADEDLIRERLREVRVYVLAHEGQRDPNYDYARASVDVGKIDGWVLGRTFNLSSVQDGDDYRWKTYLIAENPRVLR